MGCPGYSRHDVAPKGCVSYSECYGRAAVHGGNGDDSHAGEQAAMEIANPIAK
jgi:hypothetical protein